MSGQIGHTTRLQSWLDQMRQGNSHARNEVINHACERLRLHARWMLRRYPSLRKSVETDDVLNSAMLRLHRSLAEIQPESVRQFYALASTQIRRELLDLARHFSRRIEAEPIDDGQHGSAIDEPATLEEWSRFHEAIATLPDEVREVACLKWYEEMTDAEIAQVVGTSLKTVKRRWLAARLALRQIWET